MDKTLEQVMNDLCLRELTKEEVRGGIRQARSHRV